MRLTCPNCGAQYEVPDEVIPKDGRDVQCSNCGNTWYQAHPDFPDARPEPEPAGQTPPPEPEPEPQPDPVTDGLRAALTDKPPAGKTPKKQDVPEGIAKILREEAEREAQLRAAEPAEPLESQPDLGLDNMPGDEAARRAQEARNRMARMRGQTPPEPDAVGDEGSRRELLPNIEEINSTLRASDDAPPRGTAIGPVITAETGRERSGFARGFALIVIVGILMALVYMNAPRISAAVPQLEPVLNTYVMKVNQARVWLDAKLGALTPRP